MFEICCFEDLYNPPTFRQSFESASLKSPLTKEIILEVPFVAPPLKTTTESEMAIEMALSGGIGIIHKNCTAKHQAKEVATVKYRKEALDENTSILLKPTNTIKDFFNAYRLHGTKCVAITPNGRLKEPLLGLVLLKDVKDKDFNTKLETIMIQPPESQIVDKAMDLQEFNKILYKSKETKLPIIAHRNAIGSLITFTSLLINRIPKKPKFFPYASRDANKDLRVGAAIGCKDDSDNRLRLDKLVKAKVDVILLEPDNDEDQVNMLQLVKKLYPTLNVIGTAKSINEVKTLINNGVNCIRAVNFNFETFPEISIYCRNAKIPVIYDGNVKNPEEAVIALSIGATSVMLSEFELLTTNVIPKTPDAENLFNFVRKRGRIWFIMFQLQADILQFFAKHQVFSMIEYLKKKGVKTPEPDKNEEEEELLVNPSLEPPKKDDKKTTEQLQEEVKTLMKKVNVNDMLANIKELNNALEAANTEKEKTQITMEFLVKLMGKSGT